MNLAEREARFRQTDLYPVISPEFTKSRPLLEVLEAVLKGGAKVVQLRDKENPERYASESRKLTDRYGALLIINDSLEVALECGADGVHLGPGDMPIHKARASAPDLLLGASAYSLTQALYAQAQGASYISIAPLYPTPTKPELIRILGVSSIPDFLPHLKVPLVVMGGINQENIDEVLRYGARHIAMITALTQAEDIEAAVYSIIQTIKFFNSKRSSTKKSG
jgi:thiamine-phosphate pyrophosphorylase